jgi:hypothetical protein
MMKVQHLQLRKTTEEFLRVHHTEVVDLVASSPNEMDYEALSLSNVWKGHFEAIDDRCNDARCAAVVRFG